MTDEEFSVMYGDYAFVLDGTPGDQIVELCPEGSSKGLCKANVEEYIDLYLKAYTNLDALQFKTFFLTFEDVVTRKVLGVLTADVARRRICSDATISSAEFKASTKFAIHSGPDEKLEEYTNLFMSIFDELENTDRQLLLKFMCGRSRLQPGVVQEI